MAAYLQARHQIAPARNPFAVTPSDVTDLTLRRVKGLYIASAGGNVVITTQAGVDVTFTAVPAGTILPLSDIKFVKAATTSTGIVALA